MDIEQEDIEKFFEIYEDVKQKIDDIGNLIKFGKKNDWSLEDFEEHGGNVKAFFEYWPSCGCCGPERCSVEIPMHLLWNENGEEKALELGKRNRFIAKQEKIKKERKEKLENKKRNKEKELAEYKRLKEKFEN